jgi:hypothetical protein
LAIYFIVFKSPPSIGQYKWYLLNIAVMSYVYDFYMTCIWLPMPLFPSMVMCSRGLLTNTGWIIGGMLGYVCFACYAYGHIKNVGCLDVGGKVQGHKRSLW